MLKKVRIGALNYQIVEVEGPITVDRRECIGSIDYNEMLIKLLQTNAPDRKLHCLFHEIVHGIVYEYNIELPEEREEEITDAFATGFLQVIRDNPELINLAVREAALKEDGPGDQSTQKELP